jgi:hypothetical protein
MVRCPHPAFSRSRFLQKCSRRGRARWGEVGTVKTQKKMEMALHLSTSCFLHSGWSMVRSQGPEAYRILQEWLGFQIWASVVWKQHRPGAHGMAALSLPQNRMLAWIWQCSDKKCRNGGGEQGSRCKRGKTLVTWDTVLGNSQKQARDTVNGDSVSQIGGERSSGNYNLSLKVSVTWAGCGDPCR